MINLTFERIKSELERILTTNGFDEDKSERLAEIFTNNNLLGKESHGLNRFPAFMESVKAGYVKTDAEPELISSLGAFEQWNGNLGAGPINAMFCTDRAVSLSDSHGIGLVAMKNTNHWMRGGAYGWKAAEAGYILICWTNAIPTMPAWGSSRPGLGNNPLVIGVPNGDAPIVLDMALSQYSYGALEIKMRNGEKLKYDGGFSKSGAPTREPSEIMESKRALPVGLWKGSGLSLVFDMIASVMAGGQTVSEIGKQEAEFGVSQIYIAMNPRAAGSNEAAAKTIGAVLEDFYSYADDEKIYYPGELSAISRKENVKNGINVDEKLWKKIIEMER